MQPLLDLLDPDDYRFLVGLLASPINRSDDDGLRAALDLYEREGTPDARAALDRRIERALRYLGSADLAYATREALGRDPGVPFEEVLADTARMLKVALPPVSDLRIRVEKLAEAHAARTFEAMPADDQREMLRSLGVEEARVEAFLKKSAGVFAFPALVAAFDALVIQGLVRNLIFGTIAKLVGRRVAGSLFGVVAARVPWWLAFIGPAAWAVSIGSTVVTLQGPALRKTVPAVLYLGLVSRRHRMLPEHGAPGDGGPEGGA